MALPIVTVASSRILCINSYGISRRQSLVPKKHRLQDNHRNPDERNTYGYMERMLADGTKKLLVKGDILLTPEAAAVCARAELDLIGVEDQTVGDSETQKEIHRILLGAEIVIVEGLVLKEVPQGEYFLAAEPMKMADLDGSPVRPVLIEI